MSARTKMKRENVAITHLATARTTLHATYKLLRQMAELLLPRPS
jgi:hypothetical protein